MVFRKFKQNKLWRDKAIELMEQTGSKVTWQRLDDKALTKAAEPWWISRA